MPTSKVTDVDGAADYLATSVRHIRRLVFQKRIPYTKAGGKLRFFLSDLDDWLLQNRVEAER